MSLTNPIIMDFGADKTRVGFAGAAPAFTFPNRVSWNGSTALVGDAATDSGSNPFVQGSPNNWTDFKEIIRHAFGLLNANPAEQSVLITERPVNTKTNREKITQIMFEDFDVSAICVTINTFLALLASERVTGTVMHAEGGMFYTTSFLDNYMMPYAIDSAIQEARPFTMGELLGIPFTSSSVGIQDSIYRSIMKCDVDIRTTLFENIVLSGDTTLLPDIENIVKHQVSSLAPPTFNVEIIAPANRKDSTWIGGSIAAGMLTAQYWVSKQEYNTAGAAIVHQKML